jgi:hypothetical protein
MQSSSVTSTVSTNEKVVTPKNKNSHPRDALIEFDAGPHKYTCDGEAGYTSVTTWNHTHFKQFDADAIITKMMSNKNKWLLSPYYGRTREEIKEMWDKNRDEAAQLGTDMHYAIEQYYLNIINADEGADVLSANLPEKFLKFVNDFPELKPYRSEWMIFDEDVRLAGSIDMVFKASADENDDDELYIYDWKRCKDIKKTSPFNEFSHTDCISHLPDTNYWHYALQLNTYKAILESKYNKKVTKLCLVCLHPNLSSYQLLTVPDLSNEIKELFALRKQQLSLLNVE